MMDQAERRGLGLAVAGHILLFAILSVGLMLQRKPDHLPREFMDVTLTGPIGRQAAVPKPATEAPAESQAEEQGPPEEPAPAAQVAPTAEPQPAPKPEPKPKPSDKPAPAKPTADKTPPAKQQREKLNADILKGVQDAAAREKKAKGARLGPDFLKGITAEKTGGKGQAPRAAISGPQMAGLAAAIAAQVKPCYNVPQGGADASSIISILRLRFNRDGTVTGRPSVSDHQGISPGNQSYVRQMDDAATRAVLRCSPLKLPANLYEGGWEDIEFVFNPRAME